MVLITTFGMGLVGAAWATLAGNYLACIVLLAMGWRPAPRMTPPQSTPCPRPTSVSNTLTLVQTGHESTRTHAAPPCMQQPWMAHAQPRARLPRARADGGGRRYSGRRADEVRLRWHVPSRAELALLSRALGPQFLFSALKNVPPRALEELESSPSGTPASAGPRPRPLVLIGHAASLTPY